MLKEMRITVMLWGSEVDVKTGSEGIEGIEGIEGR